MLHFRNQNGISYIESLSVFTFFLNSNLVTFFPHSLRIFYESLSKDIVFQSIVKNFPKTTVLNCHNRKRARGEIIGHCYIGRLEKSRELCQSENSSCDGRKRDEISDKIV